MTRARADVIVNHVNPSLEEGQGTSQGIFAADREEKPQKACQRIDHWAEGDAVITISSGL